MSKAMNVTETTFNTEVMQSTIPVIVDFYADWCPPCLKLGPILDRIAETNEGQLKVVKVNVDNEPALAQKFQVSSIPLLVYVNEGEVIGKSEGFQNERQLQHVVDQLTAK